MAYSTGTIWKVNLPGTWESYRQWFINRPKGQFYAVPSTQPTFAPSLQDDFQTVTIERSSGGASPQITVRFKNIAD